MGMPDKFMGITDAEREAYANSENEASEAERADDEWEIEEDEPMAEAKGSELDTRVTPQDKQGKGAHTEPVNSANWRNGFLVEEKPNAWTPLTDYLNYQRLTIADVVALGLRFETEICEFQAELINGKIYAGRKAIA